MLRTILLVLAVGALLGCGGVEPDPGPRVEVEKLGQALPPDSLHHLTTEEWRSHRPIVEIEGGEGAVVVTGDYTLPNGAHVTGTAELAGGALIVTIDHHDPARGGPLITPKVAYRATVGPIAPGELEVLVRYNSWDSYHFGGIGWGVQDVLEERVVVQ